MRINPIEEQIKTASARHNIACELRNRTLIFTRGPRWRMKVMRGGHIVYDLDDDRAGAQLDEAQLRDFLTFVTDVKAIINTHTQYTQLL